MNIQNLLPQQVNSVDLNKPVITEQQTNKPSVQPEQNSQALAKSSEMSFPDQENINELLKQLTEKIALSQKVINNMPAAIKSEIRAMLAQNATLQNLNSGLSEMLQGQKEIFKELTNLSDILNDIAKLINQAEQSQEQITLPKLSDLTTQEKQMLLQKQNLQLLQQLLDSIDDPKVQEFLKKIIDNNSQMPQNKQLAEQPQISKQPIPTNSQENINNQQAKPQEQQLKELIKTFIDQQNEVFKMTSKPQQQERFWQEAEKQPVEPKTAMQRPASEKSEQTTQMTKKLENITNKDVLKEIINKLKTINQTIDKTINRPQQELVRDIVKQEIINMTKNPILVEQKIMDSQIPVKENILLDAAKQSLPADKQVVQEQIKPQDILNLVKNLQTVQSSLEELASKDQNLFKALQTMTKNIDALSPEQKELLKEVIAQTIKQTFKDNTELSTLQKALQSTVGKENLHLDKQTADLKNFETLLKTYESLQFQSKQIQQWSTALRDLASDMLKTTNMPTERTAQHMQTSFIFNITPQGEEKPNPVYINIYHDKGKNTNNGYEKYPETWLKINLNPEYLGEVTAIFHLYQENLLDVKVIFKNPEAMDEFSRFIPDIQDSMSDSNMQLNSILVV